MPSPPDPSSPAPVPTNKAGRPLRRFMARDGRDHLWALLDFFDARPVLKRTLLIAVPAFALIVGLGAWQYHHWARMNALRIGRQWLDAGRLDRAGLAIQDAITNEPDLPASWRLASDLAWRKGNRAASIEFAKKAAVQSRYETNDVLSWGDAAILADDTEKAQDALAHLDSEAARGSPRALRLAAEIARRALKFPEARDLFQAALQADTKAGIPSAAVDEVPLGIVSLQTGAPKDRERGQQLLSRWASDKDWGVDALRALLADAVAHREKVPVIRWAEALRIHPHCTLGDIPACLEAFADFDPQRFKEVLAPLEDKGLTSPTLAGQILGWLSQIGQAKEAVRWGQLLNSTTARKPPIVLGMAEALRNTRQWPELRDWVDAGEWGGDLQFLGWAYGMLAARQLGDNVRADSLWRSVYEEAKGSPAHALFLGESIYAWGYPKEAASLLWAASERADLSYQALGSLARLYQVQRDAAGQYKAFSRLNEMRPGDKNISNNFAYFGALTDLGSQTRIEHIAEDNFTREPSNVTYRATYAFVLVWSGQASKAMTLLEPLSRDWKNSHAVTFAYGATLASLGRKAEAKDVFETLNPQDLEPQEIDWIRAALH
jgi:hypothetical protein